MTGPNIDSYGREFTIPGPYLTVAEMRAANAAAGHHFFDRDNMRFFGSRIEGGPYAGRLLITSEQAGPDFPRRYTLRVIHDDGEAGTVGEFQQYSTLDMARHVAQRISLRRPR